MLARHVVVTGGPGAGKSTLGLALAQHLQTVLLSKDQLKEALHEAMPATTSQESLRLSAAAMRVLYRVAETAAAGVVMEANWKSDVDIPLLQRLRLPLLQLVCEIPARIAQDRIRERIASGQRHAVHRDAMDPAVLQEMLAAAGANTAALDLGCPLLRVHTTETVDLPAVADWIWSHNPG